MSSSSLRARAPALLRLLGGAAARQQPAAALANVAARRLFADDASLKKTVLYDFHVALGGGCWRREVLPRARLQNAASSCPPPHHAHWRVLLLAGST